MNENELDPQKQREVQQGIHRVLTNALVLLDVALLPGKHATGLKEVQEYLAMLQAEALNKISSLTPAPAPKAPVPLQPSAV